MRVGLNITVRPTRPGDVTALPAIEHAAGERSGITRNSRLAEGDIISAEQHLGYAERGLSWLALANELPVGFILAETHVSSLFIVELSVHLDWQGKGSADGSSPVSLTGPAKGLASLTLTTFRDVPWNAPFYARLGFEMITTLTPELREKREEETAHGLAYDARCAMRLPL